MYSICLPLELDNERQGWFHLDVARGRKGPNGRVLSALQERQSQVRLQGLEIMPINLQELGEA